MLTKSVALNWRVGTQKWDVEQFLLGCKPFPGIIYVSIYLLKKMNTLLKYMLVQMGLITVTKNTHEIIFVFVMCQCYRPIF